MRISRAVLRPGVVALLICASAGVGAAQKRPSAVPAKPDDATIEHVLNRTGFGPAPGDVAKVRAQGLAGYIERQLQPESIPDDRLAARLAPFQTLTMSSGAMAEEIFLPAAMARRAAQRAGEERPQPQPGAMQGERRVLAELNQQKLLRAIYSERQLEEVMVDFWFNHFNVFPGKGQTRVYVTEYERDTIRPRVFGKFRELLGAVAESPAMLFYLDNWQSASDTSPAPRRRGINENYARELLELHTLGVNGGYTQKDVQEVARAFTGWTIQQPRQGGSFRFEARIHDNGEKVVLGTKIEGAGKRDGERVLDLLATHPSTARFIATKLARRFVADDPPKALVDRAAATFTATDGDIRQVVRAILTSPEFFAPAARRAKVKTPFEFVASAVRALGIEATTVMPLVQALRGELGMPLYGAQPPTGYADRADAWVNTGALLNRMNFAVALAHGRLRGITPPAPQRGQATALWLGSAEFQRK